MPVKAGRAYKQSGSKMFRSKEKSDLSHSQQ
jgi:hypothetical protein